MKKNILLAISLTAFLLIFLNHYNFTYKCTEWAQTYNEKNSVYLQKNGGLFADVLNEDEKTCSEFSKIPDGVIVEFPVFTSVQIIKDILITIFALVCSIYVMRSTFKHK